MLDELPYDLEIPLVERRQYERSRLIVDIRFKGLEATGVASTRDIGAGGLYMNTQAELPEGAPLLLRIPCNGEHVVVNAVVIYSNPGRGVGVRFTDLSTEKRRLIECIEREVLA